MLIQGVICHPRKERGGKVSMAKDMSHSDLRRDRERFRRLEEEGVNGV